MYVARCGRGGDKIWFRVTETENCYQEKSVHLYDAEGHVEICIEEDDNANTVDKGVSGVLIEHDFEALAPPGRETNSGREATL